MALIKEYQNGNAARMVRNSVERMKAGSCPTPENEFGKFLLPFVKNLSPAIINNTQIKKLIDEARVCAMGFRVCQCEYPNAPKTMAIFLDDLAEGMLESGLAVIVSKEQAKKTIIECPGNPVITSKVDGAYREICRTYAPNCLYWNMEKLGARCLIRSKDFDSLNKNTDPRE